MIQLLTDVVLTVTGFQLIVLVIVILKQQNGDQLNKNLLVSFLLSKTFLIIRWFSFNFEIFAYEKNAYIYYASATGFFLLAPLLYLYIRSLCHQNFTLKKSQLLHLIPFLTLFVLAVMSVRIQLTAANSTLSVVENFLAYYLWNIFWTMNFIQIFLYIVLMLQAIRKYRIKIKSLYSSIEKINLNWLISLMVVICLHWLFVVTRATLGLLNIKHPDLLAVLDLFSITIFLVYTTTLVFRGLNQLKIFSGMPTGIPENGTSQNSKSSNSKLNKFDIQAYLQKLTEYMQTQKPYLTPSLTINELSEKLSIPSWQLSRVINVSFHQNFFNFVNWYRIEEAKRHFRDPNQHHKTILEILYEVGFNSKSTFNSVFKKFTGVTPKQFKKMSEIN